MVVHIALDGCRIAFVLFGNENFTEEEMDGFDIARQVDVNPLDPDEVLEVLPGRIFSTREILGCLPDA